MTSVLSDLGQYINTFWLWLSTQVSGSEIINGLLVATLTALIGYPFYLKRKRSKLADESASKIRRALTAEELKVEIDILDDKGFRAKYKKTANYLVRHKSLNRCMEKLYCEGSIKDVKINDQHSFDRNFAAGQYVYNIKLDKVYRKGERFCTTIDAELIGSFKEKIENWHLEIGYATKKATFKVSYPKSTDIINAYVFRRHDLDMELFSLPYKKSVDGDKCTIEWNFGKLKMGDQLAFEWEVQNLN